MIIGLFIRIAVRITEIKPKQNWTNTETKKLFHFSRLSTKLFIFSFVSVLHHHCCVETLSSLICHSETTAVQDLLWWVLSTLES